MAGLSIGGSQSPFKNVAPTGGASVKQKKKPNIENEQASIGAHMAQAKKTQPAQPVNITGPSLNITG